MGEFEVGNVQHLEKGIYLENKAIFQIILEENRWPESIHSSLTRGVDYFNRV